MKKRTITLYLLLGLSVVTAIFFLFRTRGLQHQLVKSETDKENLGKQVADYQQLMRIDSMLVDGNYNSALKEYNFQLENKLGKDSIGLQLRIALTENLKKLKSSRQAESDSLSKMELDSIKMARAASPMEVRRYDSLGFVLEKARVQLNNMRRQLKQKSLGEYMQFKSKKGNQMNYVGQVKNNKANGYGIALLDTGSRYEGQWRENERHGEGTFYWPDGEYYKGEYRNDLRNGSGTYYWPNKEKYVGQWKDDKRNGQGTFYGKDGKVVTKGIWKDDKLDQPSKDK